MGKNNSQGLISIQESLNIQAEQVKKVESERQKSADESNKAFTVKMDENAKAIEDMKRDMSNALNDLENKLKQDIEKDQQSIEQKFIIIQDRNEENMTKINALEISGPETTKTLLDNFDGKVKHLKDSTEDKLSGIESVINKNSEAIKHQASQIEIHSEHINSFISNNAVINSQISAVETKADDFMKYLEVERQKIDNTGSDIKNLDKAVPEIKKNTDRLDNLDSQNRNMEEILQQVNKTINDMRVSIESLNTKLENNDKITEEINGVLEQHQDDIKSLTSMLGNLQKSMSNADSNHLENVEKMKEITVIINNIKEQILIQEEKITQKSTNDFNEMKSKIQVLENDQDLSNKKINELDTGSQSLLEKLISLEKDISERCGNLDKTDETLLSIIRKLENDNNNQRGDLKSDFISKITDTENKISLLT